tara:strand:- start:798 stop:1553 length:756 start_codon:yes stop_codon:yes gene_type:complete
MKRLKKTTDNTSNFFKKNYFHISNIAIIFSITALIFYIFAFHLEDSIEEKQTYIQENRLKVEFLKEWIHDNEKVDFDAFTWETKLKSEITLHPNLSKLEEESFYYLYNFGTFPFPSLYGTYLDNINKVNDIVSDTFDTNTITYVETLLSQQYDKSENIQIIYNGPYKANNSEFVFNEIFKIYNIYKTIHLETTSCLKSKVKDIEQKSFIIENEISRFNNRTRNIILIAFSIQLLVYIFCQFLEISFERRKR